MGSFSTYGMAGIGIAAAIGFVFALSFLGNNGSIDNGASESLKTGLTTEQERTSVPPGGQATENAPMLAQDAGKEGAPAAESANMMQAELRPTLTSVVALDSNREVIGEVVPGNEFAVGKPILIRATFANQNEGMVTDRFIAIEIQNFRGTDTLSQQESLQFEPGAIFQGDIATNSTMDLELYWTPQKSGDYTLVVFSTRLELPASTMPMSPEAAIPIKVAE